MKKNTKKEHEQNQKKNGRQEKACGEKKQKNIEKTRKTTCEDVL